MSSRSPGSKPIWPASSSGIASQTTTLPGRYPVREARRLFARRDVPTHQDLVLVDGADGELADRLLRLGDGADCANSAGNGRTTSASGVTTASAGISRDAITTYTWGMTARLASPACWAIPSTITLAAPARSIPRAMERQRSASLHLLSILPLLLHSARCSGRLLSSALSIWGGSWRQRMACPDPAYEFATGFSACRPKHRHAETPMRHRRTLCRFKGSLDRRTERNGQSLLSTGPEPDPRSVGPDCRRLRVQAGDTRPQDRHDHDRGDRDQRGQQARNPTQALPPLHTLHGPT